MSNIMRSFQALKDESHVQGKEAFLCLQYRHFLKYVFDEEDTSTVKSRNSIRPSDIEEESPGRWILVSNDFREEEE